MEYVYKIIYKEIIPDKTDVTSISIFAKCEVMAYAKLFKVLNNVPPQYYDIIGISLYEIKEV